jgi:hypothetical protein
VVLFFKSFLESVVIFDAAAGVVPPTVLFVVEAGVAGAGFAAGTGFTGTGVVGLTGIVAGLVGGAGFAAGVGFAAGAY